MLAYHWGNNAEAHVSVSLGEQRWNTEASTGGTAHNPRQNRRNAEATGTPCITPGETGAGNPQKRSSSSCGRGLDLESQKKTQTQLSFNFPSALDTAEALPQLSRSKKPPAQRVSWRREGPRTCVALAPLKSSDQLARSRARSPSSCGTMMTPRGGCGGQGLSAVGGGRWH